MKIFLWLFCFATTAAMGQVPNIAIEGFNFLYNDPVGTGTATSFSYGASKDAEGLTVDVEKIVQDFKIVVKGAESREFLFKKAPSFVQDASTIELRNFNANSSDRVSLSLAYAKFVSVDDSLELKDFSLSCDKAATTGEGVFIQGCIQKLNLKSVQFSSSSTGKQKELFAIVSESLVKATDAKSLTIKSIDLKMVNGKFDLSADIKAQISGKAKGFGNMSYNQETKLLTIKISEVKFGILEVTSKVFDELKKQESATLKVKKPYVYYQLK